MNSGEFFVSMRKITSGSSSFLISLNRWTVMGFPNPQQFQLSIFKEEIGADFENPQPLSYSLALSRFCFVLRRYSVP